MPNISTPITLLQVSNLDSKTCNWYVSGANIIVETIPQYLTRVTINRRSPATLVAILAPKDGYVSLGSYEYSTFKDILANYDCKLYYFKEGLYDADFVEFLALDVLVKYDAGDTTAGYIVDKIIAGTNITLVEGIGADENKMVINAEGGLSEIAFEWCITPGLAETFSIDRYVTDGYTIISAILESDGSLTGAKIKIAGVDITGLDNMAVGTLAVFTATALNIAVTGNRITLVTSGTDSGTPTYIAGKIIVE